MKKQVIAYIHTHWDREWYREFEVFRIRLLRVFDNILEMLEKNAIPCFYFDGQVSALEDYLEIRPEKTELIKKLIKNKKLYIGPFYCLIDEFLTDRSCFSKNLEIGIKIAKKYGCEEFIGYLPDTFGHSENVVDILRDFGIDKAIVWRGCGDFPAQFSWCGMDTVNLIQGYFNDVFSINKAIEEKAKLLKSTLDKIAEKSGNIILLPIGADHLGIEPNIKEQIENINLFLDDYEIKLGSPFDYFNKVDDIYKNFTWNNELRDNSKTFTLQGCYSSRLDIKRENIECTYLLDLVSRLITNQSTPEYDSLIEYAYKMLLHNQAHDSICGCSVEDVHKENLIRYKKIKQIANTIINDFKFIKKFDKKKILNLSEKPYNGIVELKTTKKIEGYDKINTEKGFDEYLLSNTQKIPITEDYTKIYTYLVDVKNLPNNSIEYIMPNITDSDLKITDTAIENNNISLKVENNNLFINGIQFDLINYIDQGDSYNFGPKEDDTGTKLKLARSRIHLKTSSRCILKVNFEGSWDIIPLFITLDKNSNYLKFYFEWTNTEKNHLLAANFTLTSPIKEVYSEDMNKLVKRCFDPEYNIRKNLPKEKGIEVKNNTAPMQRGLLIDEQENNIGVITKGLTQYEIFGNNLSIPILRSTGVISNPQNPARTTPAGPPLEVPTLQQIGKNIAEFYVFFGNQNDFNKILSNVYNYIII